MPQKLEARAGLKEWAITGEALGQGRQIVLLRKGGLLDEDGAFSLEHSAFFLLPSWFHAEKSLVKPPHLDLWEQTARADDEGPKIAYARQFARVEQTWTLHEEAESALREVPHIWSSAYLDLRFAYNPGKPLLCAALRVWNLVEPFRYEMRSQDMGCRSWVEWEEPRVSAGSPVLSEDEFEARLLEVKKRLG